jgi:hypothetical protein
MANYRNRPYFLNFYLAFLYGKKKNWYNERYINTHRYYHRKPTSA